MARRTFGRNLESPVAKRFLIAGAVLGASLVVAGAGAVLGVVLGARALVVSAAAVKPSAPISIAPNGNAAGAPVVVAMRDMAGDRVSPGLDRAIRCHGRDLPLGAGC
jgi:hypothetical protein